MWPEPRGTFGVSEVTYEMKAQNAPELLKKMTFSALSLEAIAECLCGAGN